MFVNKCTGFTSEEWQINPVLKIKLHAVLKYFVDFLILLTFFKRKKIRILKKVNVCDIDLLRKGPLGVEGNVLEPRE